MYVFYIAIHTHLHLLYICFPTRSSFFIFAGFLARTLHFDFSDFCFLASDIWDWTWKIGGRGMEIGEGAVIYIPNNKRRRSIKVRAEQDFCI